MEIVKLGSNDLNQQDSLNCCWPPGAEVLETPSDE